MKNEDYIKSLEETPLKSCRGCRIIIAGGGTGGHIFPAIAIANALKAKQPDIEILFVGAKGKMEMEKVPQAGYKIIGLYIAGYNRSSLFKNILLPFKLAKSFGQVRQILNDFKPHAVIGVGGYSSFPVVRLAQTRGIPTFIHESNSHAGKSNGILAAKATKIFVASYGMDKFFPKEKILMTGNPVRNIFSDKKISRKEAFDFFGLKEELKTVFVMGGSLGAKSINTVIENNLNFFKENNLQLIWQTGKGYDGAAASAEEERTNIWTNAFINNMEYAYAAADIVVSRAGAMAIAELSVVAKPVIFVPYPHAAEDHQTANANALVTEHAAIMINDSEVNEKLINAIAALANDSVKTNELKENIAKLGNTNADELIANEILKTLNG
ncbi:MAG: UDP-N-acetylglucosamine--N-acetylmuramyl-(pentapeptide) pyrophosphoryl-undecaprenol [Chitinophagaceae bacterium]|nr:UDP-N-acetylglucosamine--N-acetylmuramyl-(pentapeptide) pyrophosphoryl-undecaprenol [Chitinophagaceae bacterium]